MPSFSFSSSSQPSVTSWSERIPASTYFLSPAPLSNGQWPSIIIPNRLAAAILPITTGSSLITPGKFITSPRPITPSSRSSASTSFTPKVAPEVSKGEAGTQLGTVVYTLIGCSCASRNVSLIPITPRTFAISWGSFTTVVVP